MPTNRLPFPKNSKKRQRGAPVVKKGKSAAKYIPLPAETNKRAGAHSVHTAPEWWEKEIKGKSSLRFCGCCKAVYFDEHWHTAPKLAEFASKQQGIKSELCPECRMEREGKQGLTHYEGEVTLQNLLPGEEKEEILRLARNVGKRAVKRDPEDMILRIDDMGEKVRIRTTENQLAVSIGKQVARAFKGGKLDIRWSHEDAPARVYWTRK